MEAEISALGDSKEVVLGSVQKYGFTSRSKTPIENRFFSGRCKKCWVSTFFLLTIVSQQKKIADISENALRSRETERDRAGVR